MKIVITIDPSVVECYALRHIPDRFKAGIEVAMEHLIKKQNSDGSVFGKLLFNRPDALKVEVE